MIRLHLLSRIIILTTLPACLDPPKALDNSQATQKNAIVARPVLEEFEQASSPRLMGPGMIALAATLATELQTDLQASGLSLAQAEAIAGKALTEARASVISIAYLTAVNQANSPHEPTALEMIAPFIVQGAIKAFDDVEVGLSLEQRKQTLASVVTSSFRSLHGRITDLATQDLPKFVGALVGAAVTNLNEGGIDNTASGQASYTITSASVAALDETGMVLDIIPEAITSIVTSTVSSFTNTPLTLDQISTITSQASSGAIAQLDAAEVPVETSLAITGSIPSASIQALRSFSPSNEFLGTVASGVASSAIEALAGSHIITTGQLAPAVQAIAQSACDGVNKSGIIGDELANAASSIAAGAISGLTKTASDAAIAAGGLAEAALTGTFSAVASSADLTSHGKILFIANIVERTVASLAGAGSITSKTTLLGELVGAALGGLKTLGVTDIDSVQSAVAVVSQKATASLSTAGFHANTLSQATTTLTKAAVTGLDNIGIHNASDEQIQSLLTTVITGVASGLNDLSDSGTIAQDQRQSLLTHSSQAMIESIADLDITKELARDELDNLVYNTQKDLGNVVPPKIRFDSQQYIFLVSQGVEIAARVDTAPPTDCEISPSLPTGLTLSADCKIAGIPESKSESTTYRVTPHNAHGEGESVSLTLSVIIPSTKPVLYYPASSSQDWLLGVPKSLAPSKLNGGSSAVATCTLKPNTPTLPQGLTLNTTTSPPNCVISGTPRSATSLGTSTTYTVVVTNFEGLSAEATISFRVVLSTVGSEADPADSCQQILNAGGSQGDGIYWLQNGGDSYRAYCDMTTDSGGWTLILNYVHKGGTNPALNPLVATLPVLASQTLGDDESNSRNSGGSWGHATPNMLRSLPHTELRFYCETSGHVRKIHFKTELSNCLAYFDTGLGSCSGLNLSSTALTPLHTGELPAWAVEHFSNQGDYAATNFPFWKGGTYHWGIAGEGHRWECDDYPGGDQQSTIHRIYAR